MGKWRPNKDSAGGVSPAGGGSGGGFGGGIGGLNKKFEQYQSGADLDFDTDTHRAIADQYGRVFKKQGDALYRDSMDRFNTGLMPSSIQGVAAGQLLEGNQNAYNDAILAAYQNIRGQNMDQLNQFGQMEVGNLGSQRGLAGAKAAANATRYAANQSAGASRYNTDAYSAINSRNADIAQQQWAWDAQMDLANMAYQDEYGQWNYDQGFDAQTLDDYLNRVGPIGGQGGSSQTYLGPR